MVLPTPKEIYAHTQAPGKTVRGCKRKRSNSDSEGDADHC